MISSLVILTNSMSSTAKAGYEMMDRRPASTSLDVEALGNMELRMDLRGICGSKEMVIILIFFIKAADDRHTCIGKFRALQPL